MKGWRFSPLPLLRGHWRVLSVPIANLRVRPDRVARLTLVLLPVILLAVAVKFKWTLKSPDAVLAGVALLAGSLLAAFGQVAAWREKVREIYRDYTPSQASVIQQDGIDETATHLLVAAYLSGIEAMLLIIGANVAVNKAGALTGLMAALVIALGAYILLLFLLTVPRLYTAYVEVNSVRRELSGQGR